MKQSKRGILIALTTPTQPLKVTQAYLEELNALSQTWGIQVIERFIQRLDRPCRTTFVGQGKALEIAHFIQLQEIDYAIFDDGLSPSQVRNLEKLFACTVLDRNLLIFNIFLMAAKTKQAKTQIKLAQYQYLLPRLPKMWKHLSNQKGGKSGIHGPGEKELETDKRIIQKQIAILKNKLAEIEQQCAIRRKSRANFIRLALVGYTNVGKSTLMQLLSKKSIVTEDKLFSTVDTTIRKVVLGDQPFLLTDTIGFIRKLPPLLVASFKATLMEVHEADLLLHVIDPFLPYLDEQIDVVNKILKEIGVNDKPKIIVYNKMDLLKEGNKIEQNPSLQGHPIVYISSKDQLNIDSLKQTILSEIEKIKKGGNML